MNKKFTLLCIGLFLVHNTYPINITSIFLLWSHLYNPSCNLPRDNKTNSNEIFNKDINNTNDDNPCKFYEENKPFADDNFDPCNNFENDTIVDNNISKIKNNTFNLRKK